MSRVNEGEEVRETSDIRYGGSVFTNVRTVHLFHTQRDGPSDNNS
jgi:hypothetical protein